MRWLVLLALASCHAEVARHELPAVAAAPAPTPQARHAREPAKALVWRVMEHEYVEDDGGVPVKMHIVLRLEAGDAVVGPFELPEPGCTLGSLGDDARVVAGLSCYYAGGGDYVEVHETAPGQYAVTTYAQSESFPDEPEPGKVGLRTLGTFYAARPPLDQQLVSLDGGAYEAYR